MFDSVGFSPEGYVMLSWKEKKEFIKHMNNEEYIHSRIYDCPTKALIYWNGWSDLARQCFRADRILLCKAINFFFIPDRRPTDTERLLLSYPTIRMSLEHAGLLITTAR